MSRCRDCAYCIEYDKGDKRCSYGSKTGSLDQRELDEEHGCNKFVRSQRKKLAPSKIKIAEMRKGDRVALKYQTSLF